MKDVPGEESTQRPYAPKTNSLPCMEDQRRFWNHWDKQYREDVPLDALTIRRGETVLRLLTSLPLRQSKIVEFGCANGWLSEKLAAFGDVTALDLADDVVARARARYPHITFLAGDALSVSLPIGNFDVVVSLQTLACVNDQAGFIAKIASVLKCGGYLILTTNNKFVFDRKEDVASPEPGQVWQLIGMRNIKRLMKPYFSILRTTTLAPEGHKGILRIVNSYKLNPIIEIILSRATLTNLKEWAGLGQTIVILARKKQ